tara:strand:+ start:13258 stop:13788 length:531 start_codon:yes stop_codon:yes gene_type:complete
VKKRTSSIWVTPKNKLEKIVQSSETLAEVLKKININPYVSGGHYKSLKLRLEKDDIDFSHIPLGRGSNKGRTIPKKAFPLEEVMIENSSYHRGTLKKRLLKNGILEEICAKCNRLPVWENEKLVLILDHINGINNDHRLENLRLLCPNCNSQTPTFGARNKKNKLSPGGGMHTRMV